MLALAHRKSTASGQMLPLRFFHYGVIASFLLLYLLLIHYCQTQTDLYLRLFYAHKYLGWNSEEWFIYFSSSLLVVASVTAALITTRHFLPPHKPLHSQKDHSCYLSCLHAPLYASILLRGPCFLIPSPDWNPPNAKIRLLLSSTHIPPRAHRGRGRMVRIERERRSR